jgi:hypothetical protein
MSEMQAENCLERKENEGLGLLAWEGRHLIHQNERGRNLIQVCIQHLHCT